jgi:hypothetical protein
VVHEARVDEPEEPIESPVAEALQPPAPMDPIPVIPPEPTEAGDKDHDRDESDLDDRSGEEGPVHRPLIRAQLPRTEGQPPPSRPAPDFTIRQPGGRHNRFRPRHQRGGPGFPGNRQGSNIAGNARGGSPRPHGGRPPLMSKRHGQGHGRKRSK